MLVEALVVQAAISPTIHKRSQPLESLRSRHLRRRRESSISVSLATNIVDLSRFGRDEFGDTSYCTRMIAKHHLPSLARPRLAAERPSEDGGHESTFGGGRMLGFSNPARNCDDNVAVLNRRYGDRATGRSAFG